jgi:hypothetical protein
MILSKGNLRAVEVASSAIAVLDNLHICADGTTVAASEKTVLVVSPVKSEFAKNVPLEDSGLLQRAVTIAASSIKALLRTIPRDTKFNGILEHCKVENDGVHTTFATTDGIRNKSMQAREYGREYIPWVKLVGKALIECMRNRSMRVVLNRKRLYELLKVLDGVCPDPTGESAVFVEFDSENNVILRAINPVTEQRAVALMTSYKGAEGQWLKKNKWEINIMKESLK